MANDGNWYQQIRHRATKQPAGQMTPIDKSDYPNQPADSQIVWRYLDLFKFKDMIETATLYFRRSNMFRDPLEGTLSKHGIHGTSRTDRAFAAAYPIADNYADRKAEQKIWRHRTFVNCWHMNERESGRMWRKYTESADSVVITSTVAAIRSAFPSPFLSAAVMYIAEKYPRADWHPFNIFFYKDIKFQYEREFRILRPFGVDEELDGDLKQNVERRYPIDLRKIVHRLILHKNISDTARQCVNELVHQFYPEVIIEGSSCLDCRPHRNR